MAGLCEGGNEPPGSLKTNKSIELNCAVYDDDDDDDGDDDDESEEKKKLTGSLAKKKLAIEGCTGRNGEREKSSGQKKISEYDRRHKDIWIVCGNQEESGKDGRLENIGYLPEDRLEPHK
ncbi:hypothetical protein ANN_10132 [Periplaneta americana]|uniref:Uncharacterized protein n=1 Tax=Periplaneta americana TaxID=6978 RepID=A0ABQ8TNB1_PERAM|nr:hypothetical protein ANN_10132 [Periplaneta americana]